MCKRVLFLTLLLILSTLHAGRISDRYLQRAQHKHVAESHRWLGLIHATHHKHPSINDPTFLLSYPHFTPQRELRLTLKAILDTNLTKRQNAICKYPARSYWLMQKLHLPAQTISFQECKGFAKYLQKTSDENISLVFASENVANPSSMMGHTFFKLSGHNASGKKVSHAISFYTVINTLNIPWLILKSTLLGMPGFFSLQPYQEQLYRNNILENRNVWEYLLRLDEESRRLLYYHFWELKDTHLTYLFTGYNCATIINEMLSITSLTPQKLHDLWITPTDLVKSVNRQECVQSSKLLPSDIWYLKMLLQTIPTSQKDEIYHIFHAHAFQKLSHLTLSQDPLHKVAEEALIIHYQNYLYRHHKINHATYQTIRHYTAQIAKSLHHKTIDLSHYKNPLKTPGDSRLTLGYHSGGEIAFSFLPASHTLSSDNRQYFSETALKIGEMRASLANHSLHIEQVNLYSVTSLTPWDPFTQQKSFHFALTYEPHYDTDLTPYHAYNLTLGAGLTKQIGNDLFLFSLFNVSVAYGKKRGYWYLYPDLGFILYEVWNMKSLFHYNYVYHQHNSHSAYHHLTLTQSLFLSPKHSLELKMDARHNKLHRRKEYAFEYVYTF